MWICSVCSHNRTFLCDEVPAAAGVDRRAQVVCFTLLQNTRNSTEQKTERLQQKTNSIDWCDRQRVQQLEDLVLKYPSGPVVF
jgi:hypothetical protein